MRFLLALGLGAFVVLPAAGQPLGRKLSSVQHVSVEPGVSAPAAAPGGNITLWADVKPNAGVHVYAEGAQAFDFTPASIALVPNHALSIGTARFPRAHPAPPGSVDEKVPIYSKTFRIVQPVTVKPSAKRGEAVTISAAINYQACDDRICYPPSSIPIEWTITVK